MQYTTLVTALRHVVDYANSLRLNEHKQMREIALKRRKAYIKERISEILHLKEGIRQKCPYSFHQVHLYIDLSTELAALQQGICTHIPASYIAGE